ncbi:proteasome subunit beta [Actinobacteria bacterium YIM 96077]|uniref:Proteasome subunit beta n=1 Tax=Phytoactinopolyspora halophila TaxID=1981511 RepID=A0A329R3T6_9ACTN|nr:proteasome subunit beta [Phytoactinopolyspora halophila]AYY15473.1 proteasome subunit beta [Actinobacteria bacterium YIM 96077]RAW17668.1 proteasome subunit beta [Phytoactinopolyspora halophila]
MTPGTSSFTDFLGQHAPDLLPGRRLAGKLSDGEYSEIAPHGTTIVAVTFRGGVVMAGDRRATAGHLISQHDAEKVFQADEYSAVGIAGTMGLALELVQLFRLELEHYEKIEGTVLSLEGKANRLAHMIRANLGLALQGLVAVPLFAGMDPGSERGKIFSYDPTGARSDEHSFYSVGSGSVFARGALKKLFREDFTADDAVMAALQALYDAAEDDSATGGPDVLRKIYPIVAVVDEDGYRRYEDEDLSQMVDTIVSGRSRRPDGPQAPLN